MTDLPGFPPPAVAGHAGRIRSVRIGGNLALVFLGRTHLYEGRGVATVVHGVRTAVGRGLQDDRADQRLRRTASRYRPGEAVLISDHINMTATSPIAGANFVDLTDLYSPRLRDLCREVDPSLDEGVYVQLPRPDYETPAEIGMVRAIGGDLVGMSTALEAIAAREAGAEVLGISLVTNLAAGMTGEPLNHEEVLEAGRESAARMGALLARSLGRLWPVARHGPAGQRRGRTRAPEPTRPSARLSTSRDRATESSDGVEGRQRRTATSAEARPAQGPARGDARTHEPGLAPAEEHGSPRTPTPHPRARRTALTPAEPARRGRAELAERFSRHAAVRHRRPARRAGRRPEADEPGRRDPRGGRPGRVPAASGGGGGRGGHRLRRPPQVVRLRPGHRRGDDGRRAARRAAARGRCRRRCWPSRSGTWAPRGRDGDRQPQPAAGQRLQGLPGRRLADRAARRRARSPPRSRRSARWPACRSPRDGWEVLGEDVLDAYLARAAVGGRRPAPRGAVRGLHPDARRRPATRCWPPSRGPGSPRPSPVPEQAEPDPDFPTVAFPNPEEPGAMDLAFATGRDAGPTW